MDHGCYLIRILLDHLVVLFIVILIVNINIELILRIMQLILNLNIVSFMKHMDLSDY